MLQRRADNTEPFMITANFHAISSFNLAMYNCHLKVLEQNKESIEPLYDGNAYDIVEQKRSLTIDYSKKEPKTIPVLFPSILIWILALSISFPYFILSDVNKITSLCAYHHTTKIMFSENILIQFVVSTIRIFLPTLLIIISLIFVLIKYFKTKNSRINSEEENVRSNLKLAIILTLTYLIFSLQKHYLSYFIEIFDPKNDFLKMDEMIILASNLVYYAMSSIRPLINLRYQKCIKNNFSFI